MLDRDGQRGFAVAVNHARHPAARRSARAAPLPARARGRLDLSGGGHGESSFQFSSSGGIFAENRCPARIKSGPAFSGKCSLASRPASRGVGAAGARAYSGRVPRLQEITVYRPELIISDSFLPTFAGSSSKTSPKSTGDGTMASRTTAACTLVLAGTFAFGLGGAASERLALEARLGHPVMKIGEAQRNSLRIGLRDCKGEPTRPHARQCRVGHRPFWLDEGQRIAQAREAATMAIHRLDDNDIASVVIFDDKIDVLVPAQKVTDHTPSSTASVQIMARGHDRDLRRRARGRQRGRASSRIAPAQPRRAALRWPRQCRAAPPRRVRRARRELCSEGISVSTVGLGTATTKI